MTKLSRGVVIALVALAMMAFAGVAFAFAPTFSVTTDILGNTTLNYTPSVGDPPADQLVFFVPSDYNFNLAADPGAQLGTVTASATAADLGNSKLALTGSLVNEPATQTVTYGTTTATMGALAVGCTGVTTAQSAYLLMNLSASATTLQIPVFVQVIHEGALYSDTSIAKIVICLPPPDVPAGTAGRAVSGTSFTSLSIVFQQIFSVAPGTEIWHLQATPFTAGVGKANPAGAVEVEAQDRTPQSMSLSAKRNATTHKVVASGEVKAGGKGATGVQVKILAGKKVVAKVKTTAGGKFKVSLTTTAKKLSATATAAVRTLQSCTSPILAPLPCVSDTQGAFTTTAAPVAVKG